MGLMMLLVTKWGFNQEQKHYQNYQKDKFEGDKSNTTPFQDKIEVKGILRDLTMQFTFHHKIMK